jgi:hypothetical protein
MLRLALATALDPDTGSDSPPILRYRAFRRADAAGRNATRRTDATVADVAVALLLALIENEAVDADRAPAFIDALIKELASANRRQADPVVVDVRLLVTFTISARQHPQSATRRASREKLRELLDLMINGSPETKEWRAGVRLSVPTLTVLSPMSSARRGGERESCDDLALRIANILKRRLGWDVHVHALMDREEDRSSRQLRDDHRARLRAAAAVVALGDPPSTGVGYALALVPDATPLLFLARNGQDACRFIAPEDVEWWNDEDHLAAIVEDFAASLLLETDLAAVTEPEPAEPPAHQHALGVRGVDDEMTSVLPGMSDNELHQQFSTAFKGPDQRHMLSVLDGKAWREREWLSAKELVAAREARSHYGWTAHEFRDVIASAEMERAYAHYAPSVGERTKTRPLGRADLWESLRRSRWGR